MRLSVDAQSPIPIRWQLAEQLKHAIEGGGVSRNQPLPSIRELAGFLGINPNTVARAIEGLDHLIHGCCLAAAQPRAEASSTMVPAQGQPR